MPSAPTAEIRPMTADDVEPASQVQVTAFDDLDRRTGGSPQPIGDDIWARIRGRHEHFLQHDPGGAWVATVDEAIVGCALALRRDSLWGLSLLVVHPDHQSSGAGRRLLDAALGYAAGCATAIILSSTDARAMRAYATSGFDLFPQVGGRGEVRAVPAPRRTVRDGSVADAELMDVVDRKVRGAPHGPDHHRMSTIMQAFVIDDVDGQGYAWLRGDGELSVLAATDDETATALLWRALAHCKETGTRVGLWHITGEQQWAVRVAYDARLEVKPDGPVFWRGRTPPRSYLPSGAFL